jgi:hypothetical protein
MYNLSPKPKDLAVVQINNYLWSLAKGDIKENQIFDPITGSAVLHPVTGSATYESDVWKTDSDVWNTDVFTFQPFYPVTESLAPDSAQLPYILYDYIFVPKQGTFWPLQKEEVDYIIVGDIPQIYYLKNWIVEALERYEESAKNINNYINTTASPSSIRFKYITVDQDEYIADEKRIDSFLPKFITCLKITYEYTK